VTLDELWRGCPASTASFDTVSLDALPELAARYARRAIAPATPLASAVRLSMHGEIKLKRWRTFRAEQVIRWDRGMIWQASVRMGLLPVRGSDRVVDGVGSMRWKLLGLLPVVTGAGPDITRSTIGRLLIETVWLPSVQVQHGAWEAIDQRRVGVTLSTQGHQARLVLGLGEDGRLRDVSCPRWGDPDESGRFRLAEFGGLVEDEATVSGYTIPSRLRVGWHYGTDRFEEGEFFRVTLDSAAFR
jgi:hypothetical protein